jgi:short-subunit dehydrogenase
MLDAASYGPWAVISGASEGTGKALAKQIAAAGIHCVLIARRLGPLDELADALRAAHGVECITASVDLYGSDACAEIKAVVGSREVGLYVSNAGADPSGSHFLNTSVDDWIGQANRSVINLLRCCHHFGGLMRDRKHGGLLIVGSGACYGGGAFMANYAGVKGFGLNFAEGLWAELLPHGVNVLYAALGTTDTPAFRKLLAEKGMAVPPGLADPAVVAETLLDRLPHGPVLNWGQDDDQPGMSPVSAAARRARVLAIGESTKRIFGEG